MPIHRLHIGLRPRTCSPGAASRTNNSREQSPTDRGEAWWVSSPARPGSPSAEGTVRGSRPPCIRASSAGWGETMARRSRRCGNPTSRCRAVGCCPLRQVSLCPPRNAVAGDIVGPREPPEAFVNRLRERERTATSLRCESRGQCRRVCTHPGLTRTATRRTADRGSAFMALHLPLLFAAWQARVRRSAMK